MYKMTFASDIDVLFERLIETPLCPYLKGNEKTVK
jgi:hypothetical protein